MKTWPVSTGRNVPTMYISLGFYFLFTIAVFNQKVLVQLQMRGELVP